MKQIRKTLAATLATLVVAAVPSAAFAGGHNGHDTDQLQQMQRCQMQYYGSTYARRKLLLRAFFDGRA